MRAILALRGIRISAAAFAGAAILGGGFALGTLTHEKGSVPSQTASNAPDTRALAEPITTEAEGPRIVSFASGKELPDLREEPRPASSTPTAASGGGGAGGGTTEIINP